MKIACIAVIAALVTIPAGARELISANSTATGSSQTEAFQVSEDHIVIHANSTYEAFEVQDNTSPLVGMQGKCFGTIEISGGSVSGSGSCVYKNEEGQSWHSDWTATGFNEEGALEGLWRAKRGTGPLEGIVGGGTFSSLTDPATGKFVNTIKGALLRP